MSNPRACPDDDRKMSARQQQIETIRYAWQLYLRGKAMPNAGQIFKWLAVSDMATILGLIETAAARTDLLQPRNWIPNVLCGRHHEAGNA